MTKGQGYYQPKWYEVGLDTLSQVNVLSSRFLVDIHEGTSSFRGLGNQGRTTSHIGTLPVLPGLQCQVCDECAESILSFSKVKKTGVDITYNSYKECFIVHASSGDIEFYQRGDLYLADFRDYVTSNAIPAMITLEREQLFERATVKRAQETGFLSGMLVSHLNRPQST